jgi:hypothetical protein
MSSEVRESLRMNLVGYLIAPDPLKKFTKLQDLLILAKMSDIDTSDLEAYYMQALDSYARSSAPIRGASDYLAITLKEGFKIAIELFGRMPRAILVKASEEASKKEIDLAEVVRKMQRGEISI